MPNEPHTFKVDVVPGEALKDLLGAGELILWYHKDGVAAMYTDGMTTQQTEELLLDLAADVHTKNTGAAPCGAIIVENQLADQLRRFAQELQLRTVPQTYVWNGARTAVEGLNRIIRKRGLR